MVRFSASRFGAFAALSLCIVACSPNSEESSAPVSELPLEVNFGDSSEMWSFEKISSLPSEAFVFSDGFYFKDRDVKAVRMSTLWDEVDPEGAMDVMTAYCTDEYFSVYTREFVNIYKPFIIFEVDGKTPSEWTDVLQKAAPFFISFAFEDGMPPYQDAGHKRPWGVKSVSFGQYDEKFAAFYSGDFANLSELAHEGREIWINSCSSCHEGPGGSLGGHKAVRPWEVLAVHATHNTQYFIDYTRDPKSLNPVALMEPHPQYSDAQMEALVAFVTTGL